MDLADKIKIILIETGIKSWTNFNKVLNDKFETEYTVQNLHIKFKKETIQYKELVKFMDAIGYEVNFLPKEIKTP
jgi:hypothetical protein